MIGRTNVAPLNQESIPNLELQAAVFGAHLCKFTTEESRLNFNAIDFWTVTTTVLAWINSPETQKSYCSNRINENLSVSEDQQWHHIPGKQNPAGTRSDKLRLRTWNNFGCSHQNFYFYQNLIGLNQKYRTTQLLNWFSQLQTRGELLY